MKLRLGARGSALSRVQAEWVARALDPRADVEIVTIRTTGDRLSAAGAPIGWKGDFTKELDAALLSHEIDLAVHSLKDVPSKLPPGIALAAVPKREDPSDVLAARPRRTFAELPRGARVGTSSPRRRAQVLAARPDLDVSDARGNVDTRLRRLAEGKWDAIVLARAGLARLSRLEEICDVFAPEVLLPAIGQGTLAVVGRADDRAVGDVLASIEDGASRFEAAAERSLLARLEAGCHAPVAGLARSSAGRVSLTGAVFSPDGKRILRESAEDAAERAEELGRTLADRLLARGAARILAEASA
ncbi:MAG TPA: hydroxymethylbilane synthase [Thermoanaerobaculia bacterium]|nr:hydroxymethylbilane synthase [Thermoanaerobaculia bacterium]